MLKTFFFFSAPFRALSPRPFLASNDPEGSIEGLSSWHSEPKKDPVGVVAVRLSVVELVATDDAEVRLEFIDFVEAPIDKEVIDVPVEPSDEIDFDVIVDSVRLLLLLLLFWAILDVSSVSIDFSGDLPLLSLVGVVILLDCSVFDPRESERDQKGIQERQTDNRQNNRL